MKIANNLPPKRVLMVLNEGFMPNEYTEPRESFDRAGFEVTVAAKRLGAIAPDPRDKNAKPVEAQLTFEQVDVAKFDAIAFVGGGGGWADFFPNDKVHKIVTDAMRRNVMLGLLCASTGLLGMAGNFDGQQKPVAEGRHVTGYFRVEGMLRNLGKVDYDPGVADKPYVVVDGNLITGRDPLSAQRFGETMVEQLGSI